MTVGAGISGHAGRAGQTMVEFSVVAVLTAIMLLFVVEIGRTVLVYTMVANAARAGVRYAVVHGSTRSAGATIDSASGPGNNPTQVVTVVKNFASAGLLTTSLLVVTVTSELLTYPYRSWETPRVCGHGCGPKPVRFFRQEECWLTV